MGWFDFLKKKEPAPDAAPGDETRAKTGAGAGPERPQDAQAQGMSPDGRKALQIEYTLLLFLDSVYANPLGLAHDKRSQARLLKSIVDFMDGRPAVKEYWSTPERDLLRTVGTLVSSADAYAISRGMTRSPQFLMNIVTFGISGGVFGLLILSTFIPALAAISSVLMYVGLCVICIVPNFLKRYVMARAAKFQAENLADFVKDHGPELEVIHDAVQYFLTDLREAMIDEVGQDVARYQIQLYNADYTGIHVMNSARVPGRAGMVYAVRFLNDGEDPATLAAGAAGGADVDVDFSVGSGTGDGTVDDVDEDLDDPDDGQDVDDDQVD